MGGVEAHAPCVFAARLWTSPADMSVAACTPTLRFCKIWQVEDVLRRLTRAKGIRKIRRFVLPSPTRTRRARIGSYAPVTTSIDGTSRDGTANMDGMASIDLHGVYVLV